MKKIYIIILVAACLLYISFHLITLIYSPLPWFDEVSFGCITESYLKNHTFFETERILVVPGEKLSYGPLFFMWQAFIVKLFGFTLFNMRISCMLFGFIDLVLVYKVCKKLGFSSFATGIAICFIALEPNFNQFLHSARMDYLMLGFFLFSYLLYIKINTKNTNKLILYSLLVGILLSCSMLTNPRIIFALVLYIFLFIYEVYTFERSEKKLVIIKYILITVGFLAIYSLWIQFGYGGINNFILNNKQNSQVMKEHVGIGTSISIRYNFFIFLYAIIAFVILAHKKMLRPNINLLLFGLPATISFIFIVGGGISGRYYAIASPFVSLLIVGITINILHNKLLKYITICICCAFGALFLFKVIYILSTLPQHDPKRNEQIISKYITKKNTSVCGDFLYYYIARNNGCSFFSSEANGENNDEKIKYFREQKFQYFILDKMNWNREEYEQKLLNIDYRLVAVIKDNNNIGFLSKFLSKLNYLIIDTYDCYIYELKN